MKFNEVICDGARWWTCPAVRRGIQALHTDMYTHTCAHTDMYTEGQTHTLGEEIWPMNIYNRGESENI